MDSHCEHRSSGWCSACHSREMSALRGELHDLWKCIDKCVDWLKRAQAQRRVAMEALVSSPLEADLVRSQAHVLAQAHMVFDGNLYLFKQGKRRW